MRQLAVFETEREAQRLAAYLVTQRIAAHAEQEATGHTVWVRDENQMVAAREILASYRDHPDDPRYDGVEQLAKAVKQAADAESAARERNVIEMRQRWGRGMGLTQRCPLTIALIVASVLVTAATEQYARNAPRVTPLLEHLRFVDWSSVMQERDQRASRYLGGLDPVADTDFHRPDNFASIRRGQFWRLITPIFIHYGLIHLVFNMWWMYVMGGYIEDRRGWKFFLAFVLLAAVTSNVAEATVEQLRDLWAVFGGMSGVGYAVFGYLWIKVRFEPDVGYKFSRETFFVGWLWFFLCLARDFPPFDEWLKDMLPAIANTAHVVGLLVGMAVAYMPVALRRR
jgi:GlpG protein